LYAKTPPKQTHKVAERTSKWNKLNLRVVKLFEKAGSNVQN